MITRNMTPTRITKREARERLLVATSLVEYPGREAVFGEVVAAAIGHRSAKITAFGDGSMVVQVGFDTGIARRYVVV